MERFIEGVPIIINRHKITRTSSVATDVTLIGPAGPPDGPNGGLAAKERRRHRSSSRTTEAVRGKAHVARWGDRAMAEKPGQMCVETHTLRNQKAGYPFILVYTAAYALWWSGRTAVQVATRDID